MSIEIHSLLQLICNYMLTAFLFQQIMSLLLMLPGAHNEYVFIHCMVQILALVSLVLAVHGGIWRDS